MEDLNSSTPSQSERLLATLSHLSVLLMPLLGLTDLGFIMPAIIWAMQQNKSRYVAFQSFQALTYQLCMSIVGLISYGSLFLFMFNMNIFFALSTFALIVSYSFRIYGIIGAVMAFQGKPFRYWLIGNQVEKLMPAIIKYKVLIYIILISIVALYLLIFFGAILIFSWNLT